MTLWLSLTVALGTVAYLAIWSRTPSKARWLAVCAFLVASPVAGLSLLLSLGWAVPVMPYISAPKGEFDVVGLKLEPETAIYVLLDLPEGPRLFRLPWDADKASQLQRMQEGGQGIKGRLTDKDGDALSGEFYPDAPESQVQAKPPERVHTF